MFETPPFGPKCGFESTPLSRAAQRHRFFLGSLALHAGLLWAFAQWHTDARVDAALQANSTQIQASTQAAERHGMRRHVDSLKAMKELIERIDRAQQALDPSTPDVAETSQRKDEAALAAPGAKAPAVQTPQEMLAQARMLRDRIQNIEQAARAKEMAKLLKISPQDALEKVQQQAQEKAKAEPWLDPTQVQTDEQVAQALERYEQQARESVQQRQQQLAHQTNGTHLAKAGASGAVPSDTHGSMTGAAASQDGGGGGGGRDGGGTAGAQSHRGLGGVDANARRFDAPLKPLPIDVANLRLGYGNVLGSGGAFSNRVVVDRWYVIGPFSAPDYGNMRKVYPPELLVDLDAVYLGKFNHVLRWDG